MTKNLLPLYNTIFHLSIVDCTVDKVYTRAYAYYTKAALQEARLSEMQNCVNAVS